VANLKSFSEKCIIFSSGYPEQQDLALSIVLNGKRL